MNLKLIKVFSLGLIGIFFSLNLYLLFPPLSVAIESRSIKKLIEGAETETQKREREQSLNKTIKRGRAYFLRFCSHCHGRHGKGDGSAAVYLTPKPRDFGSGIYKFHTTQDSAPPRDDDLYRTILKGIPGTAMPPWEGIIGDEVIRSLVAYIKTFSVRFEQEIPDYPVEVGLEPVFDKNSVAYGQELYRQLRCVRCHGKGGERSGPLEEHLKDAWGRAQWVFDLRHSEFYKAGYSGEAIYTTLVAGIEGTPMNSYEFLTNTERWHLVHFVQSLILKNFKFSRLPTVKLFSHKINELISLDNDHSIWEKVPAISLNLNTLKFRKRTFSAILVQSIHNDRQIAIRLQWDDPSPEIAQNKGVSFLDEAAVQFALSGKNIFEGPFHGMGERKKPVYIWHWRADASVTKQGKSFPDSSDANMLSVNPFKESSVEELNARGFGALSVQTLEDQQLRGMGNWNNGRWEVIFLRDLKTPGRFDVQFQSQKKALVAFAVWDGSNLDKSAGKLVSFWKELNLE